MRVLGQRRRERVAVVVVDDLLPQRLRDPRREAAVHLAVDQHRVEDAAAVVDRDVADGSTWPVSVSTSTTDTCAPNGNDAPDCTKSCSTASGMPSSVALVATSAHVIDFDGTPATPRVPSSVTHDVLRRGLEQVGGEAARPVEHARATPRAPRCRRAAATVNRRCRRHAAPARCRTARSAMSLDRDAELTRRRSASTRWRGPGRAPTCPPSPWRCRRGAPRPRRTRSPTRPR